MALIQSKPKTKKIKHKIEISEDILSEIKSYMDFAKIDSIDHFLAEAACFVFSKDSEWKKHKKQNVISMKNI